MSEVAAESAAHLSRLCPSLGSTCRQYLSSYHGKLERMVQHEATGGLSLAGEHSRILDGLLGALFCAAEGALQEQRGDKAGRVALVAVGGYGRKTVALHSDVDVLVLCDEPSDPYVASMAEALLYPLWDAGLSLGHALRGVGETVALAREDLKTATTLLDLRRVGGDATIVEELLREGRAHAFGATLNEFLEALSQSMQERQERYGGTPFLLEPEVKLGCGGLRDLDVLFWAGRSRWNVAGLEDLVRTGGLYARELDSLGRAREFLWRVRNLLHLRAGRQQDRLTFEDQEEIATSFGFSDGATLGVEQFMQSYYQHARTVAQLAERLLTRARPPQRRNRVATEAIGNGLVLFDGQLTFENSSQVESTPTLALRVYKEAAKRQVPVYSFARDAVSRFASDEAWCRRLRESSETGPLFLQLLSDVREVPWRHGSILGELHEQGLLLAVLPEFAPVTGRAQHDVYHVYTVDVHSIAAVDRLRSMVRGDLAGEWPLSSRLAAEAPRRVPLFLGVLLHDVGKAHGKEHSKTGAVMARAIAERLGLGPTDVDHVEWLVLEHLTLYHYATRRDINDPAIIDEFSSMVGTLERLRDLFLLTIVDLSTTNPKAMTSWKAHMLEELYSASAAKLEGNGAHTARLRATDLRKDILAASASEEQSAIQSFLDEMPDRYLLANSIDAILFHAREAEKKRTNGSDVHVALRPGPSGDLAELLVIAKDRPGLLSDVTAAFTAHRIAIVAAETYTRKSGDSNEAIDIFHVSLPHDDSYATITGALKRLSRDIEGLVRGDLEQSALLVQRPKPKWARKAGPDVRTEVHVDNSASSHFTVVDVFTHDRIGLLHLIAKTLHQQHLSIALSKVNTEGLRAADVFYVEQLSGGKVCDPAKLAQLSVVLREALREDNDASATSPDRTRESSQTDDHPDARRDESA